MELTSEEEEIRQEAIEFARKNKKKIAKRLTDRDKHPPKDYPVSVFMAGSRRLSFNNLLLWCKPRSLDVTRFCILPETERLYCSMSTVGHCGDNARLRRLIRCAQA